MDECWLHIDMDAFFASVEQVDHPEYRGKPVVVGSLPGHRGVVATCSYEARKFGIRSALPISQAYALCPDAIYVLPNMARYQEVSAEIMAIFKSHVPQIIQVSVDEAFLDLRGTRRLLGPGEEVANKIKKSIFDQLGLTLSIGMASNKYLAKLGSAFKKPNGLTIISPGSEKQFILDLPLKNLWGLGKKTLERLNYGGVHTTLDLQALAHSRIESLVGKGAAAFLACAARGEDPGIYEGDTQNHSISAETTLEFDSNDPQVLDQSLIWLCNQVIFRMRREKAQSTVIAMKLRFEDFTSCSFQKTLGHPLGSIEEAVALGRGMFAKRWDGKTPIRLIGFGLAQVKPEENRQNSLFDDPELRRSKVEEAILGIHQRFDPSLLKKASLIAKPISTKK